MTVICLLGAEQSSDAWTNSKVVGLIALSTTVLLLQ